MEKIELGDLIDEGLEISISFKGKKAYALLKILEILSDKEKASMLLEMLNDHLDEHEHDIVDFPDAWNDKVQLVEQLEQLVNEWFEEGDTSEEEE